MKSFKVLMLYIFIALLIINLTGCIEDEELTRTYSGFTPKDIDDGWVISQPKTEGIDSLELSKIYNDLYSHPQSWTLKSMLVFRNGKLVAESYFKNENDRTRYNALWSCTKQVTGIITGIAINDGFIASVHDSIGKYLPEVSNYSDKKGITLENLLTMQSGIYFNNDNQSDIFRTRATKSSVNYVLSGSLDWAPGTHFQYNDGAPQLVSAIVQNATGKTMAQYANERFFSKIGLTKYDWKVYTDGVTIGAFGLRMPPREFAKIAQCVCDSGVWNGEQIIPKDWVKQMLAVHAQDPTQNDNIGFGYFWWINKESRAVFMWGHGGQYAIIYPDKRIVCIVTALEQLGGDFTFPKEDLFIFTNRIHNLAK